MMRVKEDLEGKSRVDNFTGKKASIFDCPKGFSDQSVTVSNQIPAWVMNNLIAGKALYYITHHTTHHIL